MLQSIDHVARIVDKRRPDVGRTLDTFLAEAPIRFLDAYRHELGVHESARPERSIDLDALFTLSIVQELHEFVYAERSLPRWRYVPEAALAAPIPVAAGDPSAVPAAVVDGAGPRAHRTAGGVKGETKKCPCL